MYVDLAKLVVQESFVLATSNGQIGKMAKWAAAVTANGCRKHGIELEKQAGQAGQVGQKSLPHSSCTIALHSAEAQRHFTESH